MAKLAATEGAQQVIDAAVQIFGGLGVVSGQPVERLYREIRSLRIYEGATEVQQLIIAREILKEMRMTMEVMLPEGWPRPKGYANGVVASGKMLFVAGMIGWDAQGRFQSDDFAVQARQALQNIADVLREAGGKPENIVRMTWYVTDKREYLAAGTRSGPGVPRDHRQLQRGDDGRGSHGADRGPGQGRDRGHRRVAGSAFNLTAENFMATSKASFHWDDPLLLDQQLTGDERAVRDAAACLLPGAARSARARGLPPREDRPGHLSRDGRAGPARARPSPRPTAAPASTTSATAWSRAKSSASTRATAR